MTKQRFLIGILYLFPFALFGQNDSLCLLEAPFLSAETLTCINQSVQIHVATSQPNLKMTWYAQTGELLGSVAPAVNEPGWYIANTNRIGTTCNRKDSIFVSEDKQKPIAIANFHAYPYANLCTYGLDGHGSSIGKQFLYLWWGDMQDVYIENENSLQATTRVPSTYSLTVTDRRNGCTSTAKLNLQELNQGLFIEK